MIAKFVFNPANKDGFPHYKNCCALRSVPDGTPIVFSQLVEKDTYIALDEKGNIIGKGFFNVAKENNK